jgi:hypothetical protein
MSLPPGRWVTQGEWEFRCFSCPSHKEPKGYFNCEKGVGHCKRCGTLYTWKDFGGDQGTLKRLLDTQQGPRQWADSTGLLMPWEDSECVAYLRQRRVPQHLWWHLSYLPSTKEIYIPIYNIAGPGAPSFTRRRIDQPGWRVVGGMSTDNYVFYTGIPEKPRCMVLVEGPFDVLTPDWEEDILAVALLGTILSEEKLAWICSLLKVPLTIIWLDPDKAGTKASRKIHHTLLSHGVSPITMLKHEKEPGDLTPRECHAVLEEYVPCSR